MQAYKQNSLTIKYQYISWEEHIHALPIVVMYTCELYNVINYICKYIECNMCIV